VHLQESDVIQAARKVAESLAWHVFVARDGGRPTEAALEDDEQCIADFNRVLERTLAREGQNCG
jgi:hypothetical protein